VAVYLLHFDRPFGHARHYIGFSRSETSMEMRLKHHRAGTGARLLAVATAAGVTWSLARVWPDGDRNFERSLKSHSGTRYCPICRGPAALNRKAA
jgi:predicted GIY-YIG superfamily endonuclease